MATYDSNLMLKKNRHRGIYSGKPYDVVGRIELAEGTVLEVGDILRFAPVGENQRVNKVRSYIIGLLPTAAAEIGYQQMLDRNGDPVVVQRQGPFGDADTMFESPVTDDDAFAAAAVFSTAREVLQATAVKLAGPVDLSMTVTTGGTVGVGGVEIFCGLELDGETSTVETGGETYDADQGYLLGE